MKWNEEQSGVEWSGGEGEERRGVQCSGMKSRVNWSGGERRERGERNGVE